MNAIEVQNLSKFFGRIRAVDDISFQVQKGEIFGFLGPNGAGKTTTIRCLLDFLRPTAGRIKIFGLDFNKNNVEIKKRIGYLSGDVRLYDAWTGEDHIRFLEGLRRQSSTARELAQKLSLDLSLKFKNLSSGNKQKLGLVLALGFQPELLVMDEPTVGLDPLLQNMIYDILAQFQKQGTAIFMSSHNLTEVDKLCHRVGIIRDGKLMAIESIRALKEKRMHVVKVVFSGPYDIRHFNLANVEIKNQLPDSLVLGVKGDINSLMKVLASYNLKDLQISLATLEEIFLEFYEIPQRGVEVRQSIPDETWMNNQSGIPRAGADKHRDNHLKEIPPLE